MHAVGSACREKHTGWREQTAGEPGGNKGVGRGVKCKTRHGRGGMDRRGGCMGC